MVSAYPCYFFCFAYLRLEISPLFRGRVTVFTFWKDLTILRFKTQAILNKSMFVISKDDILYWTWGFWFAHREYRFTGNILLLKRGLPDFWLFNLELSNLGLPDKFYPVFACAVNLIFLTILGVSLRGKAINITAYNDVAHRKYSMELF